MIFWSWVIVVTVSVPGARGRVAVPTWGENRAPPPGTHFRKPTTTVRLSASHYSKALYDKLESTVLPLFHHDPAGWARVMKGAISKVGAVFTAHRMMRRYAAEAYLNCAG
jgi:hypothetical protein